MTENPQDPQVPPAPQYGTPPADPQYGTPPPPPQYGAPFQPPQPAQPPQYGTPPQAPYGTPPQPPQGQYGTPPPYGAPQYGAPQQFSGPGGAGPVSDSDRQTWSMLAHLGGIVLSFLAPLVVWAMYKDRDEFIKDQATEALNFQITLVIGYVAASVLSAILIGIALFPLLWLANLVLSIMGGLAANKGQRYRYPWALRLVK